MEELVDNSDFRAWILLPSEEKKQLWQAYIKANPEEGIKLENAKKVVLGLDNYYQKELPDAIKPDPNFAKSLTNIVRLEKAKQQRILTKPIIQRRWAIAATIALMLSVGLWFLVGETINIAEEWMVYTTDYGEWKDITLPDGSTVNLNANATLKLKKDWDNPANHQVWLTGEAVFEVAKRKVKQAKFSVLTDGLTIAVMGTVFHVKTKGDNTKVFLEEGHIQLASAHQQLDLQPSEFIDFTKGETKMTIQREVESPNTSWTKGTLVIPQKTVKEILSRLTEIYGVTFVLEDKSVASSVKTIAVPMDKLAIVLPILARTLDVKVQQINQQIILSK